MIDKEVLFPIKVQFEDGEIETYVDVSDLERNLEYFDSEIYTDCKVLDAKGRPVNLKINEKLVLEKLTLQSNV